VVTRTSLSDPSSPRDAAVLRRECNTSTASIRFGACQDGTCSEPSSQWTKQEGIAMTNTMTEQRTGRSLVSVRLFERLVARLVSDEGLSPAFATRVMDQALAFLGASASHRGEPLSPSRAVDAGWHIFVLHTRDYREFCGQVGGRFIDHVPTDDRPGESGQRALALGRTVTAMRRAGYAVDDVLWFSAADCTGCHGGCHDDPPPGL
jgi:hypothetical protein